MTTLDQVNTQLEGAKKIGAFGSVTPPPLGDIDKRRRFVDSFSGEIMFRADIPEEWTATKLTLDPTDAPGSWPFTLFFEAQDGNGAIIRYRTPHEWVQSDPNQAMMAAQMGMPPAENERAFQDPANYVDVQAAKLLDGHTATMRFLGERDWPVHPAARVSDQAAFEMIRTARQAAVDQMNAMSVGGVTSLDNVYAHSLCRTYAFDWDGTEHRMAVFTTIQSVTTSLHPQVQQPTGVFGNLQAQDIFQKIGSAAQEAGRKVGNAFQSATQSNTPNGFVQNTFGQGGTFGSAGQPAGFASAQGQPQGQPQGLNGITTTEWGDLYLFALICPADRFDNLFAGAFTDFCSTAGPDIMAVMLKDQLNLKKMEEQQAEMMRRQQEMERQALQAQQTQQFQQAPSQQQTQQGGSVWHDLIK